MTEVAETRSLVTEADFEYPPETVWKALTDSEWLAVWFFPNDIQPLAGHKFTIWGRPIERWDGEFKCEVLTVKEPSTLIFRWYGGDKELKAFGKYMDTKVTWTLTPLPNGGTHFRFEHEGFPTDPDYEPLYDVMVKGSESVLRSLAKRLPQLIEHGA